MSAPSRTERQRADVAHAARGGAVQLLSVVAQALMPLYQGVIAHLFGPAVFGIYLGSLAITDILTRFGVCGADKGMHRFISAHRAEGNEDLERRALGTGIRLSLAVATVLALALVFGSGLLVRWIGGPDRAVTLPLMAPAVVAAPLMLVLVAATLGRKVARMSLYLRGLAEPGFLLIAGLCAYALGGGLRRLAAAHALAYLATGVAAVVAASAVFGRRFFLKALRSPRHPEFVRFVIPFGAGELANILFQRTDLLLLPMFVPIEQVAAYGAAELLARIGANVRYAFDGIAAPLLSEALALGDRARLRYNLRLITRWVTTLALPLATTVVALRTDLLWVFGKFLIGGTVLLLHTGGHLLSGTLGLCGQVIAMSGRSRLILVNQVGVALLNVGLCLLLIPRLGIVGAALSVLISLVTLTVTMLIEVEILERAHPFHAALLKPVLAGVAMLAAQLALASIVPGMVARIAAVIAGGLAAYAAALLALRPAREEAEVLRAFVTRVRKIF